MEFKTIEEAQNFISKQNKEIENLKKDFTELKEKNIKNEISLKDFEKKNKEFEQKEMQVKKNDLYEKLGFEKEQYQNLDKLTKEIEFENLEKELSNENYKIFKNDRNNVKIKKEDENQKEPEKWNLDDYLDKNLPN